MTLGGGGLDRIAAERRRADGLLAGPDVAVVALWNGRPLVSGPPGATRLVRLAPEAEFVAAHPGVRALLGRAGGASYFAQDVSGWQPGHALARDAGPGRAGEDLPVTGFAGLPDDARLADFRGLITALDPLDAELAATAKGLFEWHRNHGFCAGCGAPSDAAEAGWQRLCPACGRHHFPRVDPVVIMLVTRGNRLLVGRSPGWPEGFYSLLAGFMEPGETVEAAVRREVLEESGVRVGPVRMLASQPWPFPASLMIGCHGTALSAAIRCDPAELDDALWVSRETLLEIFAGRHPTIRAPRRGAIAQALMHLWLADRID